MLAPLSLNSSLPICMGKTLSWGSISGMSVFIFLADKLRGSRRIPGGSGLTFVWVSSVEMVMPLAAGCFVWLLPSPPFAMAIVWDSNHLLPDFSLLNSPLEALKAAKRCAPLRRALRCTRDRYHSASHVSPARILVFLRSSRHSSSSRHHGNPVARYRSDSARLRPKKMHENMRMEGPTFDR